MDSSRQLQEHSTMAYTPNNPNGYRLRGYPDSEVRIYATDGGEDYPIHGAHKVNHTAPWRLTVWTARGQFHHTFYTQGLDLIDRPAPSVKEERWSFVSIAQQGLSYLNNNYSEKDAVRERHYRLHQGHRVSAIQHHVYEVPSE
jgi:lipoprotein-anchoring transpeptidase ErfK/SrfK